MAYGVLSGQSFTNDIPSDYSAEHGVESLRDPDNLALDEQIIKDSRTFAESSVQTVHRLIFPTHGIRAG